MRAWQGYAQLLIIVLLTLTPSCGQLPDYARPYIRSTDGVVQAGRNSFGYRRLSLEDFRAAALPSRLSRYHLNIQAHSCVLVLPSKDSAIHLSRGTLGDSVIYTGRFTNIAYRAVFDPDCSWWNPKAPKEHTHYILQHEQIHFALAELTARRLNRLHTDELESYIAIGNSVKEVREDLFRQARKVSRQGLKADLEQQTAFDEETSMQYAPKRQQQWFERVNRQLAKYGESNN